MNHALLEQMYIKFPMRKREIKENFCIEADDATGKSIIKINKNGYAVKFNMTNSIATVLGFIPGSTIEDVGIHMSPKIVQITNVSTLLFNTNISSPNYVNGFRSPTIYTAVLDVSPGHRWSREISQITYKKIITDSFSYLKVWIEDDGHNLINLRNEKVVITLSIRIRY